MRKSMVFLSLGAALALVLTACGDDGGKGGGAGLAVDAGAEGEGEGEGPSEGEGEGEGEVPSEGEGEGEGEGEDVALVRVSLAYPGTLAIADLEIRLYPKGTGGLTGCADDRIDPRVPALLPAATKTFLFPSLEAARRGQDLGGFADGDLLTIVGFGRVPSPRFPDDSIIVAWGCWASTDGDPSTGIRENVRLDTEIPLVDVPPTYAGTYAVTAELGILPLVPDGVAAWATELATVFTTPGPRLLAWLEETGTDLTPIAAFRDAVETALTDTAGDVLRAARPDVADGLRGGVVNPLDAMATLQVQGDLEFDEEPAPAPAAGAGVLAFPSCEGLAEGMCTQRHRWLSIGFDWSADEMCADAGNPAGSCVHEAAVRPAGLGVVQGDIDADITDLRALTVHPHSLEVAWDTLMLYAVQHVVLPAAFGAEVSNLEGMLLRLFGGPTCLGDRGAVPEACQPERPGADTCCCMLTERAGDGLGFADKTALSAACKQGLPQIAAALRSRLLGQGGPEAHALVMGTTDAFVSNMLPAGTVGRACGVRDVDPTDLIVEGLGTPEARCAWLGARAVDAAPGVEGAFHATRR